jgi:hypothetical protein
MAYRVSVAASDWIVAVAEAESLVKSFFTLNSE